MTAMASTIQHGECELLHCFSLTISAERLGEFAGILTALTFAGMIFLADRRPDKHPRIEDTLIMFVAAFISLAVATYLFTGAAAEEVQSFRAAFESFCASMALSIALQLLLLGIAQLMRDHEFPGVARFAAGVGKWVAALIIFGFMSLTAISAAGLMKPTSQEFDSAVAIGVAVFAVTLIVWMLFLSTLPRLRNRFREGWPGPTRWAKFCLIIISIVSVLTAIWAERSASTSMAEAGYLALMALLLLATMGYAGQLTDIQREPTIKRR